MRASPVYLHCQVQLTLRRRVRNAALNPVATAALLSPSGRMIKLDAFWDGGETWRIRARPDEIGVWKWHLGRDGGTFRCVPYRGENPLCLHGPVRRSPGGTHLEHSDGTPFFWLSDTAWNGVIKASPRDFENYLKRRQRQGFTAVQFVSTNWRACPADEKGERAYREDWMGFRVNPAFFHGLDAKVSAINEYGLLAAPVLLWALTERDPGRVLLEEHALLLCRYIIARWNGLHAAWILGGDGNYLGRNAVRWRHLGRELFRGRRDLVTMHPCGLTWVMDEFRREPWFGFCMYQSGHGDSPGDINWLTQGPPARESERRRRPPVPVINGEPNYEGHVSYHRAVPFDAFHVRRALMWSLLVSPTAGVSYGNHSIWFWPKRKGEIPLDHPHSGPTMMPRSAERSAGARSVAVIKAFFDSIPWWKLRPAQFLVRRQPGLRSPEDFVAAAAVPDGRLALVYTPRKAALRLDLKKLKVPMHAIWVSPASASISEAGLVKAGLVTVTPPEAGDWILILTNWARRQRSARPAL